MDLVTVALILTVFIASAWYIKSRQNLPPGPWSLPLVGSLALVRKFSRKRPHLVLYDAAKKYGNVMSFKIGNRLFVVLTGYDVIKEALVKHADVFSSRAVHLPTIQMFIKDGKGVVFNAYTTEWKFMRKFTLQTLRDFGVGKSTIEEKILVETEDVIKHLAATPDGEAVSIDLLTQKLITNIIIGIVFSQRYEYDDPKFAEIQEMNDNFFRSNGPLDIQNFLPKFLVKIIAWKDAERHKQREISVEDMQAFISRQVDEHALSFDKEHIRDFVDLYLKEVNEGNDEEKEYLTKGNIFRTIMDLFLAGTETTITSLAWAFLYMAVYPEVQKKCQQEIDKVFGDKVVHWSDRNQLPYVTATIMEVQRVAIILPVSVSHCTTRDTTFRGYTIPKNTTVMPSLYSATIDTKYWNKPEVFNPERFIGESGEVLNNEALIPFSIGPRACLGEPLARMELFLVFTNLLQRFRFRCESDTVRPSLEPRLNNITNSPVQHKLRVYDRHTNA